MKSGAAYERALSVNYTLLCAQPSGVPAVVYNNKQPIIIFPRTHSACQTETNTTNTLSALTAGII